MNPLFLLRLIFLFKKVRDMNVKDFAVNRWNERSTKIMLLLTAVGAAKLFLPPEWGTLIDQVMIALGLTGAVIPDKKTP